MAKRKKSKKKYKGARLHMLMPNINGIEAKVECAKIRQAEEARQSAIAKSRFQLLFDEGIISQMPVTIPRAQWDGKACDAEIGTIVVGEITDQPEHWALELVGERVKCLRINTEHDGPFYIDDSTGCGTWKVYYRGGSSSVGHKSIPCHDHDGFEKFDLITERAMLNERVNAYKKTLKRGAFAKAPETLKRDMTLRLRGKQKIHKGSDHYYVTVKNRKYKCALDAPEVEINEDAKYWVAVPTSSEMHAFTQKLAWTYNEEGEPIACFVEKQ